MTILEPHLGLLARPAAKQLLPATEGTPRPKPKTQSPAMTLTTRLKARASCPCIRELRERARAAQQLGDTPGLIRWIIARSKIKGLDQGEEAEDELAEIESLAWQAARYQQTRIVNAWQSSGSQSQGVEERMQARVEAAATREAQRRQHNPQAALERSLAAAAAAPAAPIAPVAPTAPAQVATPEQTPKARTWSTSCQGEMGARLAHNIDVVLDQIRATEDKSTWEIDDPEFPYEAAHQIIESLQAENQVPEGLDDLLADVLSEVKPEEDDPEPDDRPGEVAKNFIRNANDISKLPTDTTSLYALAAIEREEAEAEAEAESTQSAWDLLCETNEPLAVLGRLHTSLAAAPMDGTVTLTTADVLTLVQPLIRSL